jgi:hypothetical protein
MRNSVITNRNCKQNTPWLLLGIEHILTVDPMVDNNAVVVGVASNPLIARPVPRLLLLPRAPPKLHATDVDSPAILHRAAHTQISPLLVVVPVLVTLITTPLVNHNTHVQLHLLLETMPLPKRGMPPIAAHIMHLYAWLVVYTWHQQ